MEQKKSKLALGRKEFWKNLLIHNLGIKLLSCVCAILAWLLVTNIADPVREKTFAVPVETINEDAISSANMVYEIVEGNIASVKVEGKRSLVDKLTSEDFIATADLSELSSVNAVPINAKLRKNSSNDIIIECNQVLKISLENMEKKQVKVVVGTSGEPGGDYSVGECIAKPNVIEVRGGESVVDRVESVGVTVNVSGATENFSQKVTPVAYDKKGRRVTSSTLSFNVSDVRVRVKLLQKKTIPVKIQVKGEPADGYELVDVSNFPDEIEIAGSNKILQSVSQLTLPVDITGVTDSSAKLEQNINVEEFLRDGISVPAEEERNISVKIIVEKRQTKTVQMSYSQVKFRNVREGYQAEIVMDRAGFTLEIAGRESVLSALTDASLTAYVDCGNRGEGNYSLPIELNLDSSCSLVDRVHVTVHISKKEEEQVVATPSPAPTATPETEITASPVPPQDE